MNFNMHNTEARRKEKKHLNFSKDSKFPSDIHSYKLQPLIESRFLYHLNQFESSHMDRFSTGSRFIVTSLAHNACCKSFLFLTALVFQMWPWVGRRALRWASALSTRSAQGQFQSSSGAQSLAPADRRQDQHGLWSRGLRISAALQWGKTVRPSVSVPVWGISHSHSDSLS